MIRTKTSKNTLSVRQFNFAKVSKYVLSQKKIMKTLIIPAVVLMSLTACGGDNTETKKDLALCDCVDENGTVKQSDDCKKIAGSATAEAIEACMGTIESDDNEEMAVTASPETEAFLKKFKDLKLPYKLEYDAENYSVRPLGGTSLKSAEQEKFMDTGGYDENDNGMHVSAVGKIKISERKYVLVYTELMVPMPSVYDETSIAIFDVQTGIGQSVELAYVRGGAGMGSQVMTATIKRDGDNLVIEQKLVDEEEIDGEDGPEQGPVTTYRIVYSIDAKGNLSDAKKTTVSVVNR
jgi:hypothetical protein